MPVLLASLLGGLLSIAGSMVGRVLIALGISAVTYTGVTVTLNFVKADMLAQINGMNPVIVQMLSLLGVGQAINIVCSALVARLTLAGLTGDTMKKWVMK